MNLIREAIATAVLILLLPASQQYDEHGELVEKQLRLNEKAERIPELLKCNAGSNIVLPQICDGHFDCENGADEKCYFGELCEEINQCKCAHKNDCIQRDRSHFYLFEDEHSSQSYFHVKAGEPMILECPIIDKYNLHTINWYRNDKNIPSKCQITTWISSNRASELSCPDMANEDEGIYACELIYNGRYKYMDVSVFVKNKFNFTMDSCFCFEPTTNCNQNANVTIDRKEVQLFSESSFAILLTTTYDPKTIIPNYTVLRDVNTATISQSKANGTVYYALSKQITDLKLKLYGGAFTYELFSFFQKTNIKDEKAPLALMRDGDGKVLVYYETGNYNRNTNLKRLSFSKHNWHALTGDNVIEESASEEDVMRVLSNLDEIYIRVHYDVTDFITRDAKVDLSSVEFINNGLGMPSSIGQCSCPAGYSGNYCERCSVNYTGNPVNNTFCTLVPDNKRENSSSPTGHSKDSSDSHDTSDKTDLITVPNKGQNNATFTCDSGTMTMSLSKACDGYYDCRDGSDEECDPKKCIGINQCRCARTDECIQRNQSHIYMFFELRDNLHFHINAGSFMTMECPIQIDKNVHTIHWFRNNMGLPEKCQILSNPTKSNRVSQLYCPNMTIDDEGVYSCEQSHYSSYYRYNRYIIRRITVNDESTPRKNSCVYFENNTHCENIDNFLRHIQERTFSDSLSPILMTTTDDGKTIINDRIFVGMNSSTIPQSVKGTVFYALSYKITFWNYKLYQGALLYEISSLYEETVTEDDSATPFAIMRGNGKVLVYRDDGKYNRKSHQRKLSFSEKNWHELDGNKVKQASVSNIDFLMVLNNLNGIYVRLNYRSDNLQSIVSSTIQSDLSLFNFDDFSSIIPFLSINDSSIYGGNYYDERHAEDYDKINGFSYRIIMLKNLQEKANPQKYLTLRMPYFQVKSGEIMILECKKGSIFPPEGLNWYRNDVGVPSKCQINTIKNGDWISWLYCPNMTSEDEGVYSCEMTFDLVSDGDKCYKHDVAITIEHSAVREYLCFCFGVTDSCEKTNVIAKPNRVELFSQQLSPVLLTTGHEGEAIIVNYPILNNTKIGRIQSKVNEIIFYPLSEKITSMKVKLYGGSFQYKMLPNNENIIIMNGNDPLALMYDKHGRTLVYYETGKSNEQFKLKKISFSEHNWYKIEGGNNATRVKASAVDIIKFLGNLDRIYIRSRYYVDISSSTELFIVEPAKNGLGMPWFMKKCLCPLEYDGFYCDRCAENYFGDPANNRSCRPSINLKSLNNETLSQNYSTPYVHVIPGEPLILECPVDPFSYYELNKNVNWYRNDRGVPSKCEITTPKTFNLRSWLYCPNMTIEDEGVYSCEEIYDDKDNKNIDVVILIKNETTFKKESCFCFGETTNCLNTNIITHRKKNYFFSEISPILLTTLEEGKIIVPNFTIFKGKHVRNVIQSTADGTIYYSLSEKIINKKLELYGGSLTYKIFKRSQDIIIKNENVPLAVMRGDDKVLVYYETGHDNTNSMHRRVSFTKQNWFMLQDQNGTQASASEADLMRVLGNLDGIFLKLYYSTKDGLFSVWSELSTVEFVKNGSGRTSSIEKCSCPPEYIGNYCEKCAGNYTGDPTKDIPCVSVEISDEEPTVPQEPLLTDIIEENSPGSSPNPAQFLVKSIDCLVLYFFSLCCLIWWYRFI